MHQTHNITVVIRSANERTEALSALLLKKQVLSENITIIQERPFLTALKRSFQIGIEANRRWTLCVDADVLIRDRAIDDLITFAENTNDNTFGCSGFIFDKLRGGAHSGGLHLYRSKFLLDALSLMPDEATEARPETYVKKTMKGKGHEWPLTRQVFGLHDFEQYYRDIFRKMVVRAHKSSNELSTLLARVSNLASIENDFLVALWGLRIGMINKQVPRIDANQWRKEIDLLLTAQGIQEKDCLPVDRGEQLVSRLMAEEAASVGIIDHQAFAVSFASKLQLLKMMKRKKLVWYMGWLINRFGMKIQKYASD